MQHSSIMSVSFYPLWSVINAECDFSCGLCGWRVNVKVIHGEARQLTCDLKYVELCTGVNGEEERKRRSDLWYLHLKLKITTDFQACLDIEWILIFLSLSIIMMIFHMCVPCLPSHKGFNMKVHWNVFWRNDGDTDTAGEILSARMNHMALAFKNPFSKYQHGSNDGFWRTQRISLILWQLRINSLILTGLICFLISVKLWPWCTNSFPHCS